MENPVPVQPSEDSPQPTKKKKYVGLSILAGFLYGVPTLLIGFVVSVTLIFIGYAYVTPLFPNLNLLDKAQIAVRVIVGLAAFIGFVLAMVAGITSSRTAYRRSNEDGTPRQVGYGMLSCAGIGLIWLLVFPLLCEAGYFGILALIGALHLENNPIFSIITGGGESLFGIIILFCLPSIGIFLAYIAALISGPIVYRRLNRKSTSVGGN